MARPCAGARARSRAVPTRQGRASQVWPTSRDATLPAPFRCLRRLHRARVPEGKGDKVCFAPTSSVRAVEAMLKAIGTGWQSQLAAPVQVSRARSPSAAQANRIRIAVCLKSIHWPMCQGPICSVSASAFSLVASRPTPKIPPTMGNVTTHPSKFVIWRDLSAVRFELTRLTGRRRSGVYLPHPGVRATRAMDDAAVPTLRLSARRGPGRRLP
jgi:hypothetical protein